jgi:hypothetical protein
VIDRNLEAGAPKRQRGREAADPASDYDDSHVREHLRSCAPPAYAGVQGSLSYRSFRSKAFRGGRRPSRCCADCEGRGQRRRPGRRPVWRRSRSAAAGAGGSLSLASTNRMRPTCVRVSTDRARNTQPERAEWNNLGHGNNSIQQEGAAKRTPERFGFEPDQMATAAKPLLGRN